MKYNVSKNSSRSFQGFTTVELISTVVILAIITTIAMPAIGNTRSSVRSAKLVSDAQTLNQIVSVYLASGGSLSGIKDPQAVLNHLKTVLSESDKAQNVGVMTGRGLDARLSVQMQSNADSGTTNARALWDSNKQKFVVSSAPGTPGISSFDLDSSLAAVAVAKETRTPSNVLYNSAPGWVWANATAPDNQPLLGPSGLGSVVNQENKYQAGNSSTPPPASGSMTLPPPILTPGGMFFRSMFPNLIYINPNGSPAGSSVLQYQLNNGPWMIYTGPFSVASGTKVTAKNVSANPALYPDSGSAMEVYISLIESFAGTVAAKWNASSGLSGLLKSSLNNSNANSVVETDGTATGSSGNGSNTFTFSRQASFSGVAPNTTFKLGQIVYHNGTVVSGTPSTGLSLHLDLTLSNPQVATTGTNINMALENSVNTSQGGGAKSADTCTLTNPITNYSVQIDGVTYTLIVKYGDISSDQGFVEGNTLNVWEGADGQVDILGIFVSA